jgi:hypothetical protein
MKASPLYQDADISRFGYLEAIDLLINLPEIYQ